MTSHVEAGTINDDAACMCMADLIDAHDWTATSLGDRGYWSPGLRTTVDLMLGSGYAMCLMWGPDRVFLYNDAYAALLGTRHPCALGMPTQRVWPELWADIGPLVARTFAGETLNFQNMPFFVTRHDYPEDTWWTLSSSPVRDEAGAVVASLTVTNETTAQVLAEREREKAIASLRESERFVRSVLVSSKDCIEVLDLDAKLVFMSEGGQKVMDVSDFGEIVGRPWSDFWQGDGNLAAKEAIIAAKAGNTTAFQSCSDTMKGRRGCWDVRVSPIIDTDGRLERILAVSRDITVLKASEDARAVLTQELAHRMKNLLAMVQSITTQTLRQAQSMDEGREAVFTRISALARAQDILVRSSFDEADVGDIVGAAIAPHQTVDQRIKASGPCFGLTAQQGLGLSLAIHELATNAAKYGALSTEAGHVAMSWDTANGAFEFNWIETGGPPVVTPQRRGFGSKLIERIVASYFDGEAHIIFDPTGIRFKLTDAPAYNRRPPDENE